MLSVRFAPGFALLIHSAMEKKYVVVKTDDRRYIVVSPLESLLELYGKPLTKPLEFENAKARAVQFASRERKLK